MDSLIELEVSDLPLALGLIAVAIALSVWQRLGLEFQILMAAGRALLQLAVVGYVIAFIFALNNPLAVLAIIFTMITIGAIVSRNRISKRLPNLLPVVWGSIFVSIFFTIAYTVVLIIQPSSWYQPQYLVPLAGIIIGSATNSSAIAGERLASRIRQSRQEIETHLCLGATPADAIAQYRTEAIRAGLIPVLNQMMIAGLVSLPGTFIGQVLAGVEPVNAVSYQILILFMIVATNLMTTLLVTAGVTRGCFNDRSQLIYW